MKKIITLLLMLTSAFTVAGQVQNKAASFAGAATSKASFGNISEINGVSQFTFEAWLYIDQWRENSYVFSKIGSTSSRIDMQLGTAANRRLFFHVANGTNSYAAADNSTISVGKWHHVAIAYDGSQGAYNMIKVFIDGAPINLWYSGGNGLLPATTPVNAANFELGSGFAGKIDEARLWNTHLAATDLDRQNTLNNYHPLYASLVAYWKMDQDGSNIIDYKGSYNGTMSNGSLVAVTDNPTFVYRRVSTYIRSNFYETGRISEESLLNNNDIIYLTTNTYANGDLFFEYPVNNGVLANAEQLCRP
ncbi:LamG domain-containing protein [Adhaeribacter rhizoryzae]|uniref:LamG domain-containing protein n=1 Tax=Adhaeribacter rhizoryzae TaxID=2607907 RepID=A0A5M6D8K6_9BACT|nr:LamG domain-containing protein [Adhaeribacter rhizoryzae]KAA5542966.1 LamG domain-containing protein [Adhaeribacter rhizoryzae]